MAKESLEMLFRELKALESSSTDATQVYQVAPLLSHAHTSHSTVRVISVHLFHGSSQPCSTLPYSSHNSTVLHTTLPLHTLIVGSPPFSPLQPSPSLSSPHLMISHPTHLFLPTSLPPPSFPLVPPLPSPPNHIFPPLSPELSLPLPISTLPPPPLPTHRLLKQWPCCRPASSSYPPSLTGRGEFRR